MKGKIIKNRINNVASTTPNTRYNIVVIFNLFPPFFNLTTVCNRSVCKQGKKEKQLYLLLQIFFQYFLIFSKKLLKY